MCIINDTKVTCVKQKIPTVKVGLRSSAIDEVKVKIYSASATVNRVGRALCSTTDTAPIYKTNLNNIVVS